jgi:hypothetical protein
VVRRVVALVLVAGCGRIGFGDQVAELSFGADAVGFGNITCGETATQVLPLRNVGTGPLVLGTRSTLAGLELITPAGAVLAPEDELVIAAGEEIELSVRATAPSVSSP